MKFVHLHVHSHYSLLDGLAKIDELILRAKEDGSEALALTDHGVMYGAIEFYEKCKKEGIKPIIGVEAYLAPNSRHDKIARSDEKNYYHLILLAKNLEGYKNLIKLTTIAHLEGFYYKPRIDWEVLEKHSAGLVAMTACIGGEIPALILAGKIERAKKRALEYNKLFGQGNFYFEIQDHPDLRGQDEVNAKLIELSRELNIPLVASNDVHYLNKEDEQAQDVLLCLQNKKKIEDRDRMNMTGVDYSMRSGRDIAEKFKHVPEAIENTVKIAEMCNLEIELGNIQLPYFAVPEGEDGNSLLRKWCEEGIEKRYGALNTPPEPHPKTSPQPSPSQGEGAGFRKERGPKEGTFNPPTPLSKRGLLTPQPPLSGGQIKERLDFELSVIKKMGWPSYFLIVADFVNWAKKNGIVVGPGRGSAAGSLVCYLTGITNLDPLKYDLLFERFLNPDRISMPDIDLDFADTRRDEVIEYVGNKYGANHVAQIITFGTMAARAAVRDVGRVLNYPYDYCDKLAKMIPMFMKLDEAIKTVPELREIYGEEAGKKILDFAKKLEGVARHASTHACGVLITKDPLNENVPLQYASSSDKSIVSQYSLHPIEDLGLLKMDFLGLKNLTIIESAIKIIKNTRGIEIDIEKIPLDDKKAYKLFQKAETTGVFQFESSGMKRYMRELKPSDFEDIVAMVALYRPGPMEWIPDYIAGKHGKKKPSYLHPKLEPILKKTHGVAIYQEQVMQMARDLAGFTMAEADVLRKAVGKKIPELLVEQKEKFIDGSVKNGISSQLAEKIFSFIEPFAGYGFNRCLAGNTLITDAKSGKQLTISEIHDLYKKKKRLPPVLTLKENFQFSKGKITQVFDNGEKNIYKIKTRLGKSISATANHPFRVLFGWKKLEELKAGDRIALARRAPISGKDYKIKNHKLTVLGYLISEGNLCHPQSFYFYSKNRLELSDYVKSLNKFKNTKAKLDFSKSVVSAYAGRIKLNEKSEAVEWIKKLGIHNLKAVEKFLPDFVYELSQEQLSLLVGKMFQGDGCISLSRNYPQIFYATSSEKLAEQLQSLLLKMEVISTIHRKKFKYRGGIKIGYTVTISRYNNIINFLRGPGKYLIGEKKKNIRKAVKEHLILNNKIKTNAARGSKDIIPAEAMGILLEKIKNKGYSLKKFAKKYNIAERLFYKDKKKTGYLRETLVVIGKALKDRQILNLAESDVYWDEIVEIKKIGKEKTYDLTIQGTHNFLANDFIVHNSHAACYALIGYQTAYLKAHWPTEFMAALLTADQQNIDRIAVEIEECRKMGIEVKSPDINQSFGSFTVVTSGTEKNEIVGADEKVDTIRFGLKAIKNVGDNIAEAIIAERKENGVFKDITDLLERVNDKDLNKKSLESLAKSGALDKFAERGQILGNMENILRFSKEANDSQKNGQESLFANAPTVNMEHKIRLNPASAAEKKEILKWEKELLGVYITAHPVSDFKNYLENIVVPLAELAVDKAAKDVNVAGVITTIKKIITRSGESMVFAKIEDAAASVEVLVFPRLLKETPTIWEEGKVVLIGGKISDKDAEVKILANKAVELTTEKAEAEIKRFNATQVFNGNRNGFNNNGFNNNSYAPRPVASGTLYSVPDATGPAVKKEMPIAPAPLKLIFEKDLDAEEMNKLRELLTKNTGESKVYFKVKQDGGDKILETGFRVNYNPDFVRLITSTFGEAITVVDK